MFRGIIRQTVCEDCEDIENFKELLSMNCSRILYLLGVPKLQNADLPAGAESC